MAQFSRNKMPGVVELMKVSMSDDVMLKLSSTNASWKTHGGESDAEDVAEIDAVTESEPEVLAVSDAVEVVDAVAPLLRLPVAESVSLPLAVVAAVDGAEDAALKVAVSDVVEVVDGVTPLLRVRDALADQDSVEDVEAEANRVSDGVAEPDALVDFEAVDVVEALARRVTLAVDDAVTEAERDSVDVVLTDGSCTW